DRSFNIKFSLPIECCKSQAMRGIQSPIRLLRNLRNLRMIFVLKYDYPQITQMMSSDVDIYYRGLYFGLFALSLLPFVLCFSNVKPGDKLDIVFLELLTKGLTGKEVEIALSPRSSPVRMINGRCSHFLVIISDVDDHFSYSRLHCLQCIGVELRPTVSLN